jgi:hypothetical protein
MKKLARGTGNAALTPSTPTSAYRLTGFVVAVILLDVCHAGMRDFYVTTNYMQMDVLDDVFMD